MSLVKLEMPYFPDPTIGRPVYNGSIYIGEPDTDPELVVNQKTVLLRQESGIDVPTAQPILTGPGGVPVYLGSPVKLIVEGDYALKVLNSQGVQVYYSPNSVDIEELLDELETVGYYLPFTNVAALEAATLTAGQLVETKGYYTAGDGGQARYLIKTAVDYGATPDGYGDHELANGNVAKLQTEGAVNVKQFGEGSAALQAACDYASDINITDDLYIEGITVTDTTLHGMGGTLYYASGATEPMLTLSGASKLLGVSFNGNAAGQTSSIEAILTDTAPDFEIEGCTFTDFRYKVFQSDVANSPRGRIIANTFVDNGTVSSCSQIETRSPYCIISENTFKNIGDGHCIRIGLLSGDDTSVPVTGTIISNNVFKESEHVAITLELYAQHTNIIGNIIDGTEAAIKAETAGFTVYDITIIGNTIKNTLIDTSLNLTVPEVVFSGNNVTNVPAGLDVGNRATVSNNYFDNVGSLSDTLSPIRQVSSFTGLVCTGNTIYSSEYGGIVTASSGNGIIISNNVIRNITGESAIRVAGIDAVVSGNSIDDCVDGIEFISTAENFVCTGNTITNETGSKILFINNTGSSTAELANNPQYTVPADSKTIASGEITIANWATDIKIDTEAAAATDDLDTINGGYDGQIIILRTSSVSRDVTVKDTTGNIRLAGDMVLDTTSDILTLIKVPSLGWMELSRSNNA